MIEINPQEYTLKLAEKYQFQCLQFFQDILDLQVQIDLRDKKIKELELKLAEREGVDVDSTSNI